MDELEILNISTKASILSLLAVAVTEYEEQSPNAYPSIEPITIKQGLAVLLDGCMHQLREEILQAGLPGTYHDKLSTACGCTKALADMAVEAESDTEVYEDLCSFSYVVVDVVSRLAVELEELA